MNRTLFQSEAYKRITEGKLFCQGEETLVYSEQRFLKLLRISTTRHPSSKRGLLQAYWRSMLTKWTFPIIYTFDHLPYPAKKKGTVIVDLKEKDIWEQIDKDQRTAVRRARKEGIIVKELKSKKEWNTYLQMLKELQQRKGLFTLDERFFWRCFTDQKFCRLKGAFHEKKLVAGCLFFVHEKEAFYKNSACKPDYYRHQPVPLILWEFIEELQREKYQMFDMGGYDLSAKKGSPKYRINRFKRDWGRVVEYYEYAPRTYFLLRRIANTFKRMRKKP